MKSVQILLSTYNGEKYLVELLESLLNQKGVDIKISVRDDGSTDTTPEILKRYSKAGKLEYFVGENVGYQESFLKIAEYCKDKSDYYAFCDQDDVWEPEKMINAVEKLEEINPGEYKLYFSNLKVTDENLNQIGLKDYSRQNVSLGCTLVRSNVSGTTMVFNNSLLRLAVKSSNSKVRIGHDAWIYMLCLSVGGTIVFDPNSYIKYRQHGNNVTGVKQGIRKRLSRELKIFTSKKNFVSKTAETIYKEHYNLILKENLTLLYEASTYKNSFKKTVKFMFNKDMKFGVPVIDMLNKIEILLRCY
ncbi:MAG: glycosyltransferase [Clostridia bacterium]